MRSFDELLLDAPAERDEPRGSNAAQIDWLARNRIGFDGVPEQLARYASELGTEGIPQARDFVAQFAARNPQDADALTAGILRNLPDDAARSRFLGRDPVFGHPAGVRLPGSFAQAELRPMLMREEDAPDAQVQNRNLLERVDAPAEKAPASDREDETPPQTAEATPEKRDPLGPDKAAIRSDIEEFEKYAKSKDYVGTNSECVALVKDALPQLGATPNWRAGDQIKAPNDPPLQPGTAVATFAPDAGKNGELRYPNKPTGNHAGIFMGYGEKNGRQGMWLLDQWNGRPPQQTFYPFERRPKELGNSAGQFSVIRPNSGQAVP